MLEILLSPDFNNEYKVIKDILRPFELVLLEKFIQEIIDNPEKGYKKENTNIYKCGIVTFYFDYTLTYEYNKKKKKLIFWSIE